MSKGSQTRQNIVAKAIGLASTLGLDKITIGNLARDMAMSKSGLFAHFKSKEQLQLAILEKAVERFIEIVVAPALTEPRGIPRIRALFDNWCNWIKSLPGGCIFLKAASEVDDRPGPMREYLKQSQRDWTDTLAGAARIAVEEGHFQDELDCAQFAFEAKGIFCAHQIYQRLLDDEGAGEHLRRAYEALIDRSR
ncbi:MAG: TetR/AcrR family transcriptional regulator [bacterium]